MKRIVLTLLAVVLLPFAVAGQDALERGIAAEGKGLDDLAENYYRQVADSNRGAALRLGLLLERRELYGEAARWLTRADSGAAAMAELARCQTELQQWADAKRSAEKALELADTADHRLRALAMSSLALVYCNDESYTNALHWANRAAAEDPTSPRTLNTKGIVLFRRGETL